MYTSYPTAPSPPPPPPPPLQNTDLHASWGLAREWSASLQEAPCPLPFTYPPPPSSSKHRPPCLLELGKGVLIITTRGTHAHNTVVLLPGSYTTCLTAVFHLPKDLSFNVIHTWKRKRQREKGSIEIKTKKWKLNHFIQIWDILQKFRMFPLLKW